MTDSKKNNFSFLFYVGVSERIGLGHLYRCRALILSLQYLEQKQISIYCSDLELAIKILGDTNIHFVSYQNNKLIPMFDVIIADYPELPLSEQTELKRHCAILVGIVDFPEKKTMFDIMIRPTFVLNKTDAKEIWQGRDYILLHPEFSQKRILKGSCLTVVNLLICFGGSDPNNLTSIVLPLLKAQLPDLNLTVVTGAGYKNKGILNKKKSGNKKVKFLDNIYCLAEEFLRTDVALVSGGTLMFEACCLGVPSIVICQNNYQNKEAELLDNKGAVLNLGVFSEVSTDDIVRAVKMVCKGIGIRQKLSFNARNTVSDKGCIHTAYRLLQRAKENIL